MCGEFRTSPCGKGGTQLQIAKLEDPVLEGRSTQLGKS